MEILKFSASKLQQYFTLKFNTKIFVLTADVYQFQIWVIVPPDY